MLGFPWCLFILLSVRRLKNTKKGGGGGGGGIGRLNNTKKCGGGVDREPGEGIQKKNLWGRGIVQKIR